ncbi:MAG: uracil-DNA glycosylase [Bacteroidales bacterium]|nr:uracil-DNA glycosylase [Bacteroidales bacterium]
MDVKIESSWKEVLKDEFVKPYFQEIAAFLHKEKREGKTIYPPGPLIFNAFELTPFDKVRVVIIGQDPYHGAGQAHGLSFSVPDGIAIPPSLKNIYKEIESDLGIAPRQSGNLEHWAKQGVFLLNAILTVRANQAASHSNIGWQKFTDAVISKISQQKKGVVFLLWGNYAKGKRELICSDGNLILEAAHPSPLARGAFFGCKHFSKTNNFLIAQGQEPVVW